MAFDPLSNILNLASTVIDKIFPDKNEAEKAKVKMAELAMQGQLEELKAQTSLMLEQMNINKEEAKNASMWVAGARPFIMWICGCSLAYNYILQPMLGFFTGWPMPALDSTELMALLMGMLGFGAYRSYDKRVQKNG